MPKENVDALDAFALADEIVQARKDDTRARTKRSHTESKILAIATFSNCFRCRSSRGESSEHSKTAASIAGCDELIVV